MSKVWVTLARVVRPQGRRGEVLADLFTDFPERFKDHPEAFLRLTGADPVSALVEDSWLPTGRSAGRIVLKLRGIDSITAAEGLLAAEVVIPAEERAVLDEGTFYVSELLGCRIMNRGDLIGIVTDMQFPQDPTGRRIEDAAAIFVVDRAEGDEAMIPFASAFIVRIDPAGKVIEMALPDGLLQMNG